MRILAITLLLISLACKNAPTEATAPEILSEDLVQVDLTIEGMTCSGCESTIETNLSSLGGIAEIDAEHTSGSAHITANASSLDTTLIKETVESAGYHVVSIAIIE